MTSIKRDKLNNLITQMPADVVLTSKWLKEQGISTKLAWWYVHSGWLEHLGEGAYRKIGETVTAFGAISALQMQLKLPLHIGGKTALALLGQSHFIPRLGIKSMAIFAQPGTLIPKWVHNQAIWGDAFKIYKPNLFQLENIKLGIVEITRDKVSFLLSTPERAALEMLYLVPTQQSYEEALLLLESLNQLRPDILQILLERCTSIKVKRLFLYLADTYQHPWLTELDLKKIDLGKGKRVIGKGGKYSAQYQLSVPKVAGE
ncbi:type IV toxin-antitoxin system AbiEi family antitoxin [soil metagenome]